MTDSMAPDLVKHEQDDAAKAAVLQRYWHFCGKWAERQTKINEHLSDIKKLEGEQSEFIEQLANCSAAGKLFGFDVVIEAQRIVELQNQQQGYFTVVEAPAAAPFIQRSVFKGPKIKDLVLQHVERVYPGSIKAAEIRQQLADQGITVHEKTVGMTLTRLGAKRLVRCDGWNWFFVPQQNGENAPSSVIAGAGLFN